MDATPKSARPRGLTGAAVITAAVILIVVAVWLAAAGPSFGAS